MKLPWLSAALHGSVLVAVETEHQESFGVNRILLQTDVL